MPQHVPFPRYLIWSDGTRTLIDDNSIIMQTEITDVKSSVVDDVYTLEEHKAQLKIALDIFKLTGMMPALPLSTK
jgi:hypothetical protein